MFPMGHVAFAYFVHWRITRRVLTVGVFVALAAGAVMPTALGELLLNWSPFAISNLWVHSLVIPIGLWALWLLAHITRRRNRAVPWLFAFALGYTTHMLSDPVFDMLHLFFSSRTDDVGTSWLFPFYNIVVRHPRLDPGFYLVWWQVGVESLALTVALGHWWWQRRRRGRVVDGKEEEPLEASRK